MLEYTIVKPDGIVVLNPNPPLTKGDIVGLGTTVDAYLADHSNIHGVLIHAKAFPCWESFAGFIAHIRFVKDHHHKSNEWRWSWIVLSPFMAADIKYLPFADFETALAWFKTP